MDCLKGASLLIEEYNPRSNQWKRVAEIPTRRLQFGVAVLENKLYLSGTQPLCCNLMNELAHLFFTVSFLCILDALISGRWMLLWADAENFIRNLLHVLCF